MLNNLLQMHLKLFQKKVIRETAEAIKLQESQKLHPRIIWKQMKKRLEKNIYPKTKTKIIDGLRLK